jgi:cell division protein FtsB
MTTRRKLAVQALLVVGLLSAGLHAQSVGIGTATPDPSARLHIEDNARGLLIPNVALNATNVAAPVTSPATSLLVYNTATAGTGATAVTPGFYYWDGTKWVRLLGGGDAWLLNGNAGTNPAVNFLGTTDAQPLVIATTNTTTPQPIQIRVGNQETFRFNPPGAGAPAWSIQRGGGNQRGLHAVDLQSARAQATQVASGRYSVISGGENNTASSSYATVGGGYQNTASTYATVGGGRQNTADGYESTVGGGHENTASSLHGTIAGGWDNTVTVDGEHGTIGGGERNTVSSWWATVGGGRENTASNWLATVGGGNENTASGIAATVGGGQFNTASGRDATVGGGAFNTASGGVATVGGGEFNTASGNFSVVPGGRSNTANAAYNLVFGENVDPSVTETHRVYFFGDGSCLPEDEDEDENCRSSGFLVINRLNGDHPIHVGTNGTNGGGAHLTTGGTWTNGSSRSFKERFVQYRPAEVLEKILQLPVEGYFYKGTEEYHITPMAEDFYRLFGTGVHEIIETDSTGQLVRRPNPDVDKYLAASDIAGVALLGIQALHEENAQLRQRVSDMRMEDAQLRQRVADLGTENAQLRQRVADLEAENAQLRQQISDIRMEDAQLRQRVSDLERENAQLRQQISDIRTENAALRARLERLETFMQRIASTQTNP